MMVMSQMTVQSNIGNCYEVNYLQSKARITVQLIEEGFHMSMQVMILTSYMMMPSAHFRVKIKCGLLLGTGEGWSLGKSFGLDLNTHALEEKSKKNNFKKK